METLVFLGVCLVVALTVPSAETKKFSQCELAQVLKKSGIDGFVSTKVADWVCLAKYESSYDTKAINDNGNSRDYGIFQINSKHWHDDGRTPDAKNACHIDCRKLLNDNIEDDLKCAKQIAEEAKGLTPWIGWKNHCQGKKVDKYVKGCF
ncbi:lysozyme C-like [Sceloporus undulatus]|uniref:lysozyme C-like n=1 Tax=Sceloporus undulatus TaxID=8520 RepID=UPI001C4B96FF|nr:lysozyme C-like [Sceloporus undulatus]